MKERYQQLSAIAGVLALLAVAGFWWGKQQASKDAAVSPASKSSSRTVEKPVEAEVAPAPQEKPQPSLATNSPAQVNAVAPSPSAASTASHRHEANCAHCLAETKLTACRVDYAQMRFQQLSADLEMDEAEAAKLREACRKLADMAVREWSFAESRPEMVPEAMIQQWEKEHIEPVMASITARK